MKRKLLSCLFVVLMLILVSSCSDDRKYVNILPANASCVVSVDVPQIAEKCGMDAGGKKQLVEALSGMFRKEMGRESASVMERILEDPRQSGLDLENKVYAFSVGSSNKEIGVLASVADKKKVDALFEVLSDEKLCSPLEETEGYMQTVLGQSVITYNDYAFLVFTSGRSSEIASLKEKVATWMAAEADKSFAASDDFPGLAEAGADLSGILTLDLLPASYLAVLKAELPKGFSLDGMKVLADVNSEKGQMVIDIKTVYGNDEQKALAEKQKGIAGKMSTKLMEDFPSDLLLWTGVNLKGGRLYEFLDENLFTENQLKKQPLPVDIERMLNSVDGEVLFGITAKENMRFLLYAEVKDEAILSELERLEPLLKLTGDKMKMVKKDEHAYQVIASDGRMLGMGKEPASVYFGVRNNIFYVTNTEAWVDGGAKENNLLRVPWAGEVEGSYGFSMINIEEFSDIILKNVKNAENDFLLQCIKYITVCAKDETHNRIVLVGMDGDTNILHQWIEAAGKVNLLNK